MSNTQKIDGERKVVLRLIDAVSYIIADFLPRSEWEVRKAVKGEVIVTNLALMSAYRHIDPRGWPSIGTIIPVKLIGKRKFRTGKQVNAHLVKIDTQRSLERAALKEINSVKVI